MLVGIIDRRDPRYRPAVVRDQDFLAFLLDQPEILECFRFEDRFRHFDRRTSSRAVRSPRTASKRQTAPPSKRPSLLASLSPERRIDLIGVVMAIFTPLVGWARIRLKHHTPVQILIGWMVSMICVFVVFRLML